MPSDWTPSLVTVNPGSFENIWVLNPQTKQLEEMLPGGSGLANQAALVRAVRARFWFRKVQRPVSNDWIWIGHDLARSDDRAGFGAKVFETQSLDGPVMWAMAMGALS